MLELMLAPDEKAPEVRLNGRRFRKEILRFGRFRHPNPAFRDNSKYDLKFDSEFADKLIQNFLAGHVDSVKYLSNHDETTARAHGSVVELMKTDRGVDAIIEVEDKDKIKEVAAMMGDGKTLGHGVSAGIDFGFELSESGKGKVDGPVLRHVAATPIPWIDKMKDWELVEQAHKNVNFGHDNYTGIPLVPDEEDYDSMDMKALIARLSNETGKSEDEVKSALAELGIEDEESKTKKNEEDSRKDFLKQLGIIMNENKSAKGEEPKEDKTKDEEENVEEKVNEILNSRLTPLADTIIKLSKSLEEGQKTQKEMEQAALKREATEAVETLVNAGRVLPKNRETYIAMYLKDKDIFDQVTEALPVQVNFSNEDRDTPLHMQSVPWKKGLSDAEVEASVSELVKMANSMRTVTQFDTALKKNDN